MVMFELTVLTLNVWGIPFISSDRLPRINAIAEELSSGKYDIVSLQEVWSQKDFSILQEKSSKALPYSHYFHSGVMGAGLLVLSKYPIVGTLFHAWSVNGYFHRIQHADWFGGKGVGLCRLVVNGQIVHLYTAHLHAEYDNENDDYKTHRVIQAFDTAQFIDATKGESILQILAGDLNTKPDDISYNVLIYTSKMRDCCAHKIFSTNECEGNSYTSKEAKSRNPEGIRIDHIFMSSAKHIHASVLEYILPFPRRVPGKKFSYSDHEAVMAKIFVKDSASSDCYSTSSCEMVNDSNNDNIEACASSISEVRCSILNLESHIHRNDKQCQNHNSFPKQKAILKEAISLCESSLKQLTIDRIFYFSIAFILFLFLVVLIEISVPTGFKTILLLIKFLLFGIILFCIFMGTIWNFIERNGVLSGKKAMEILLYLSDTY